MKAQQAICTIYGIVCRRLARAEYMVRGPIAEDANDTLEIQTNVNFHEGEKCSVGSHARPLKLMIFDCSSFRRKGRHRSDSAPTA